MLLVRTEVRPSPIHGLGLFAAEPIAAGSVWWKFDGKYDVSLPATALNLLPQVQQEFWERCGFKSRDLIVLPFDNARFVNNSTEPNSHDGPDGCSIASRAIAAGEEITKNYEAF